MLTLHDALEPAPDVEPWVDEEPAWCGDVRAVLRRFRTSPPEEVEAEIGDLGTSMWYAFESFALRSANLALQTRSADPILDGIYALSLISIDARDLRDTLITACALNYISGLLKFDYADLVGIVSGWPGTLEPKYMNIMAMCAPDIASPYLTLDQASGTPILRPSKPTLETLKTLLRLRYSYNLPRNDEDDASLDESIKQLRVKLGVTNLDDLMPPKPTIGTLKNLIRVRAIEIPGVSHSEKDNAEFDARIERLRVELGVASLDDLE